MVDVPEFVLQPLKSTYLSNFFVKEKTPQKDS